MNSVENFDDLIELGPTRVHEQTHISRDKLVLLFSKSYGKINKVQFLGYLSILEREYKLNLNEIRNEYLDYIEKNNTATVKSNYTLMRPRKKSIAVRIIVWLIVILLVVFAALNYGVHSDDKTIILDATSDIVEVDDNTTELSIDENIVQEIKQEAIEEPKQKETKEISKASELYISPRYELWYGIKDLDSNDTKQATTKEEIILDSSKKSLLILGHGMVTLVERENNTTLNEKSSLYLLCESGKITKLTHSQFLEYNGGKKWGE